MQKIDGFPRLLGNIFNKNRTMKLSFVLLILALFNVQANTFSQNTKINLDVENETIQNVLEKIESKSDFKFFYKSSDIDENRIVSLKAKNKKIAEILDQIFEGQPVTYSMVKNQIILKRGPDKIIRTKSDNKTNEGAYSEKKIDQYTISGTITDSQGVPIPGVNVLEKNTTNGVAADFDGNYTIQVSGPESILTFSSIGYASQERVVGQATTMDIVMTEDAQALDEVVITALGIKRDKKALSYSVSEVGGENFTQAREVNIGNALTGRIAGVNASGTAAGPGASSRIIIRGNGSLGGSNQPLIVVNGIPIGNNNQSYSGASNGGSIDRGNGLSSINPDDIETITVLKGGTSAALYGSRAANGVILITTKSGAVREGIGVEINSTTTVEAPSLIPDWQYKYGSGTRGVAPTSQAEAIANGRVSWGAPMDGSLVVQPDGVARPYVPQKDNISHFYNLGQTYSNTLALVGGNESVNFRFSASNMDNKGIVPNSTINRKIFNLSANANLSEKIDFSGNVQYNIEKGNNRTALNNFTNNPNASVALLATSIDVRTLSPGYDADGNETLWNDYIFTTNPYFAVNKVKNEDVRRRFIGSFSIRYNFTDNFYGQTRIGIDHSSFQGMDIAPSGIAYNPRGRVTNEQNTRYETNAEVSLGYSNNFGDFSTNLLVGANRMFQQFNGVGLDSDLLNIPFQYFIRNGRSPAFSQGFSESSINSVFGSADIGYKNYLYLTFTGRKDWFSTLSLDNNNLFYPSVGTSLIFSEMLNSKPSWLTYGKVRASWAQVGGGAPAPYGLNLVYESTPASHLGQSLVNIDGNTLPNSNLRPYTSTTTEIGLELRLFNSRLGLDLTLYDRTTTDDIVAATVAPTSSYSSVLLNVGEMKNQGIELLLTGSPISSSGPKGFNWDTGFNLAYNENTVVHIADGLTSLNTGGGTRSQNGYVYHYEGQPFGMVSGYGFMKDESGNVIYNPDTGMPLRSEFMALGRGVHPLTIGFTNDFRFKNLSLGFLIDGKFGGKMYSATNDYAAFYGKSQVTVANNVRETGIVNSGVDLNGNPFSTTLTAQDYYQRLALNYTTPFVYDASFIKLRQLTFGYNFPESFISKTPLQSASISFVARNLCILYSEIPNIDPESANTNGNGQGIEGLGTLPTRSMGVNLMLSF